MAVDLRTRYLGLELSSPLIAASSPATADVEALKRLEDAGCAAVVLPSLFEEETEHEQMELLRFLERGSDSFSEASDYRPFLRGFHAGPEAYLRAVEAARGAVSIPVIASLNGATPGGWSRYAERIEATGADALELNIGFVPIDLAASASEVESRYLEIVARVRSATRLPLAVKTGPFFTAFAGFARQLREAGADGLVLFNRFVHPDIDLEGLTVRPNLVLSSPHEMRLPMMWIALLRGRLDLSLCASTGVHSVEDVVKLLLVGADAIAAASALLLHGPAHMQTMVTGLRSWLEEYDYDSVEQMKGSLSREHSPNPEAFERINYMRTLASFTGRAP